MAFLSRFIHLQPILRAECRSIVRVFASGDCTSILLVFSSGKPWSVLNSLTFQQDVRTKNYLASCNLFSTDSKTPKGKPETDNTILKKLESSLKSKTRRYYTEEEDELIKERVKQMGSDNPETWKSLAKELNVKQPQNVKRRYNLLVKRHNIVTGAFTEEEDRIILKDVEKYGNTLETFKELCTKLKRHHNQNIRRRFDWLQGKPSEPAGAWDFCQDQMLIEHIFQVHR